MWIGIILHEQISLCLVNLPVDSIGAAWYSMGVGQARSQPRNGAAARGGNQSALPTVGAQVDSTRMAVRRSTFAVWAYAHYVRRT